MRQTTLNLTNRVISGTLLVVGAVAAGLLVWLGQTGGFPTAVFVGMTAVVTIAALHSIEFGLMALILVASTDGFLKALSPGWHTQLLKDYIIAICLLRWAWLSVMGHRRDSMRTPVTLPIVVFGCWVLVQLLNVRSESLRISLAGVRMWTIWLPVFFLAYDTFDTRAKIERMVLYLIALMVPLSLYAIIQYQIGLDHLYALGSGFEIYRWESYTGSAGEELRPPATMISPHALADTLVMVALMGVGAAGHFRRNRVAQAGILGSIPVMAIAMLLTAVRNAAGSAVLGVVALLAIRRRLDLAVLAGIIGILAVLQVDALTGGEAVARARSIIENPSYTQRRILGPWRTSVSWALSHPLGGGVATGVGLGRMSSPELTQRTFSPENRLPFIENEYGRALLELGFPGLFFYLWMLFAVFRQMYRAYYQLSDQRHRWLVAGIFGACASILARLLVGPALYGWPEAPVFWIFVAFAVRLPEIEREELLRRQAPSSEMRATVLGAETLPWARGADEHRR
ncbi:MAG: O-antigen ligase family protein [Armatimonadota bacterium]|jgi:hypothetical protein